MLNLLQKLVELTKLDLQLDFALNSRIVEILSFLLLDLTFENMVDGFHKLYHENP